MKKLLNVKSIVTILLSVVFCYLAIVKVITGEQFFNIFMIIIAFYYGTQHQKTEVVEKKEVE